MDKGPGPAAEPQAQGSWRPPACRPNEGQRGSPTINMDLSLSLSLSLSLGIYIYISMYIYYNDDKTHICCYYYPASSRASIRSAPAKRVPMSFSGRRFWVTRAAAPRFAREASSKKQHQVAGLPGRWPGRAGAAGHGEPAVGPAELARAWQRGGQQGVVSRTRSCRSASQLASCPAS